MAFVPVPRALAAFGAIALLATRASAQSDTIPRSDTGTVVRAGLLPRDTVPLPDTTALPGAISFTVIGSTSEEHLRLSQLRGHAPTRGFLLRSPSSLLEAGRGSSWYGVTPILPQLELINNTGIAFSMNDGALWAGRGASMTARAGVVGEWANLRLVLAPEFVASQNDPYRLVDTSIYPTVHPELSPYGSPWFYRQGRMDYPLRMGGAAIRKLTPGQSSITVTVGPVAAGGGTENQWWGPGIWNALLLSNNAPGFAHAFLRTSHPVRTRVGDFEAKWIVGGLQESDYYDFDPANDLRSISLLGVTFQPWWDRNLTLGAARAVYSVAGGWSDVFGNAGQVLADVGTPNAHPWLDTTSYRGRDQLFSLFFRWAIPGAGVIPGEGVEVYGEWGRMEQPRSLRDFLYEPNHTQAYTVGAQWLGRKAWNVGRFRARGELTNLELSPTFRSRPTGTWYASRAVEQGYTNQGQSLGAAIGPGSSSQHLGAGFVADTWQVEALAARIRWQNDVQAERITYPSGGWCEHDVSMMGGGRASVRSRFGNVTLAYLAGQRYNPFFSPRQPSCPGRNLGDVRNYTFSLGLESALPGF